MLKLDITEIDIFKQLLAYIEDHYVPPLYRKIVEDDPLDRIYDIRKVDFCFNANKRESKFCLSILRYFNEDYDRLRICCSRACISPALFAKICEKTFSPSKEGVCKIAIAANMKFDSALQCLHDANIQFSDYNKFDVAMMFFLENRIFDFCTINKLLYLLDVPMLCYTYI